MVHPLPVAARASVHEFAGHACLDPKLKSSFRCVVDDIEITGNEVVGAKFISDADMWRELLGACNSQITRLFDDGPGSTMVYANESPRKRLVQDRMISEPVSSAGNPPVPEQGDRCRTDMSESPSVGSANDLSPGSADVRRSTG